MFTQVTHNTRSISAFALAIVVMCAAALPASAARLSDGYKPPVMKQVERLLQKKQPQPQQALDLLATREHRLHPSQTQGMRCQALVMLKEADQAVEACSQAIEFNSLNEQWIDHNNLGAAYLYTGDLQAALASFKNALKINWSAKNTRQNIKLTKHWIANPDEYEEAYLDSLGTEKAEVNEISAIIEVFEISEIKS